MSEISPKTYTLARVRSVPMEIVFGSSLGSSSIGGAVGVGVGVGPDGCVGTGVGVRVAVGIGVAVGAGVGVVCPSLAFTTAL